jgi:hypothetical protein
MCRETETGHQAMDETSACSGCPRDWRWETRRPDAGLRTTRSSRASSRTGVTWWTACWTWRVRWACYVCKSGRVSGGGVLRNRMDVRGTAGEDLELTDAYCGSRCRGA